ncbi:putative ribonuclease H-like domain-containing protein [Tanacetum coccineum]
MISTKQVKGITQFYLLTLETSCPLNLILVLADEEEYVFSESITSVLAIATSKVKTSESKPKSISEPLIEDWISDSGDENETEFKSKLRKPSFAKVEFVKSNEHVKIPRESVEKVENNKQAKYPRKNSQSPRVNNVRRNVTTAGTKVVVSDNKGHEANVVKALACWVWRPKQKLLDHVSRHNGASMNFKRFDFVDARGISKHMIGNKSYLSDYEEIDGGFVAFRGDPKGGQITGKGKISTGKLDFEDVYFVKELKFNLFSVSQMCDKKNSVLFTDTKCVVLSPDFQLLDENHVLLRVPIKDNMYSLDLKNIVLLGGLTCLFAKAILYESNLWHRRLRHTNFKTINKLVKGNLVRSLPLKLFEINQTCVACQKGKHHRASFVTDDYSRFSWVFFLATKDETSEILKTFITSIENLIDLKVKVIKCDNEIEFKNKVMNQFCEIKGIKREFSVARTPQQNGVVERKNKTLIEAARTMLADSKLPTTFWAKAVNTACYVQNRVEEIPNIAGNGPNWLFDIDALTKSMNYEPVVARNQSNGVAGTKSCKNAGKASMETVPGKDYILLPFLTQDPPFSSSSKDSPDAGFKPSGEKENKDAEYLENEDSEVPNTEEPRVNQEQDESVNSTNNINTASSTVNTGSIEDNVVDENTVYRCADDPNMPNLEEIVYLEDDEGVGAKADMNNLDKFMHGYTQEEGIDYDEVFAPVARIEAIRQFLAYASVKDFVVYQMNVKSAFLYGKIKKEVYVCQPPRFKDPEFPNRVYNVEKALYGLHQALRAWYETLSTYLLDNGFQRGKIDKTLFIKRVKGDILLVQVYVDDIIFGSTKKSLCTEFKKLMHKKSQMSSMGELTFFLRLQVTRKDDGIFISQDKYVDEILKKFGFSTVKTASTPMETSKSLMKDENAEDVDVHLYRSMIGSLMYLTSSRPDIMFVVCACARFQVTPKVSHLHAVKRIFRYLKGQPKLGLWYPKDSPFDLEAYTDSDYAGASLDRKSTTGGCQFLGSRLISWQCKKQTVVANSTTEAEYVAASSCCGQVLWIQNQLLDYGYNFMNTKIFIDNESTICIVKNPVFHSKTKHIEIRHHFIRDSYEKRLIQVIKIHTDHNVADLLTKAFDIDDWNGLEMLRMKLGLKLVTQKVNAAGHYLVLLGEIILTGKKNADFDEIVDFLNANPIRYALTSSGPTTLVVDETVHEERRDSMERASTTAASLDAEQDNGNIIRTQSMATLSKPIP